jgi:hypothetical protein
MGLSGISIWQMLIVFFIMLPIYFLPTIIALVRNHHYKMPIILINIFGGVLWGIGWFVALVWCFIVPPKASAMSLGIASEIERLDALKEKGAITQAEFDKQKSKLLGDS